MPDRAKMQPRIRLLREIAAGPLSAVFAGVRSAQGARDVVAVKVLLQRTDDDVGRVIRLRDRGRDLRNLAHPNVHWVEEAVQVEDYVGLVSPYVDGLDLLEWCEILGEEGVMMPGRVVCEIVRSAAVALDAALNRVPQGKLEPLGRIHRDVRPTNLMVSRDGVVKVLDFSTGFSALAGRAARAAALQKGLIKYMAPERRYGKRGGEPADIYSLGIVAVELFRGRWLRRLRSHNPAHDRHLAEVVARLTGLGMRTDADELSLRNLLLRMVAFDQDARPEASEVAQTFRTLADRAEGPSLASFVHTHGAPDMEDPWVVGSDELAGAEVRVLDAGDSLERTPEDLAAGSPFKVRKLGSGEWLETDKGWEKNSNAELPDELLDPYLEDETLGGTVEETSRGTERADGQGTPLFTSSPPRSDIDLAPGVPPKPPLPTPEPAASREIAALAPVPVSAASELPSPTPPPAPPDRTPAPPPAGPVPAPTPVPASRRQPRNIGLAMLLAVGAGALLAGVLITLAAVWFFTQ